MPHRSPTHPPRALSRWVLISGALCAAGSAAGQSWRITPTLDTTATVTNNSGFDDSRDGKGDTIIDLAPRVAVFSHGGNYRLDADFGFDALVYTRKSRSNEILPEGTLAFNSTLVERWVYFDVNARIAQTAEDPFVGRADVATGANRLMTVGYDFAPSINHDFSPTLNGTARSQWAWNRREALRDIDAQTHQVRLEQRTIPVGWALDFSSQRTHYQGDDDPALVTSAFRGSALYSPDTRWKAGLILGRERNEFGGSSDDDSIVGLSLDGAPTERTLATVTAERRFFGTGWNVSLRHRSPFMGLSAQWLRRPTAQGNTLDVANSTTTAQLLDAMLTTRHPDPVEREAIVRNMLAQLALPTQLGGAVEITGDAPQLNETARVSALFQGRLTTFAFSAFRTELTPLRRRDGDAGDAGPETLATRQVGFSVDLNRRLDALTSADAYLEVARLRQRDTLEDESSRDRILRLSLTRQLDPATTATVAVRRRLRELTLDGDARSLSETGLLVGLSHRF